MPLLRVDERAVERLTSLPESGMGYQLVRYRDDLLIVFNATLVLPFSELRGKQFSEDDFNRLSGDPEASPVANLEPIPFEGNVRLAFSNFGVEAKDPGVDLMASESVTAPPVNVIPPNRPHAYYRFSSFWRDRRVDARSGDFLPGTYATTYNDLHFVPSGFAAVGRYALPNPASARYVFQLVTFDRPTLMGTATPNYGQAGGGVEVLFGNGARQGRGLSFMINAG